MITLSRDLLVQIKERLDECEGLTPRTVSWSDWLAVNRAARRLLEEYCKLVVAQRAYEVRLGAAAAAASRRPPPLKNLNASTPDACAALGDAEVTSAP